MAREYFCAYHSYIEAMEQLNDAERGRLFTACLQYSKTGEVPQLRGNERFLFSGMKQQIDRDKEAYAAKCEQNRINGSSGRQRSPAVATKRGAFATKEKEKEKAKEKRTPPISPPCVPDPVFVAYAGDDKEILDLLSDFEKMRNAIKAPMTERARKNLCSELEKLGRGSRSRKMAILNKSILNNWKGVFPLKGEEEEEIANRDKIFRAPDLR